jgi:3-dehydroquinate synthase
MTIHSLLRDYPVEWDETAGFVARLQESPQRLVVVDENVWKHHSGGCLAGLDRKFVEVFAVSEDRKNLAGVEALYDLLIGRAAKRNLALVSIGGGILQDLTGFAASTLYRGIPWVFVPTTLLAQADSCIGSKTSLNYKGFKNLLGTFYPPRAVYLHPAFVLTQKDADYASGLGEVIKLHLMGGREKARQLAGLLPRLKARDLTALGAAVRQSLAIKYSYFAGDEFDTGRRNLLNFGHCFGHALEATSAFRIPHGQGIVLGMLLANEVACRRGLLSAEATSALARDLLLPGLYVRPRPAEWDAAALIEAMGKDKKRTGAGLALVMLKDDFDLIKVDDLAPEEVRSVLGALAGALVERP